MKVAVIGILAVVGGTLASDDAKNDERWGDAVKGLASRLSLTTKEPRLGEPVRVRLEVKNVGEGPATYDSQQAAVNNSLIVKGPDGAAVPYIGLSYQTLGGPTALGPGETKSVFAELDVAAQYLIERAGNYTVQSRARGGIPASNVLAMTVRPGTLSDFQKLFATLYRSTPAGWRAATYESSIVFLHTPTHLKADAASITLSLFREPTGGPKPMRGQPAPINLGETTLGQAWLVAQSQIAVERWPDYEKTVREKIKPFLKAGLVEPR
jgi:hypothetical protein